MFFLAVLFLLCLCARLFIQICCWERADLLALVVSNCEFVTFPLVSWVRCVT